jgi:hypothetical protein
MYLTVQLLKQKKGLRQRAENEPAIRDAGPDISIRKGKRTIWIEAIAPDVGDVPEDRVPDLFPQDQFEHTPNLSRRQIELRITSALLTKARKFQTYREQGIVGENDSCIVAISAGQFSLQAIEAGLPCAVTAVYPFGREYFRLNRNGTPQLSGPHFEVSAEIERARGAPIPRTAFQHPMFAHISGLLWSRLSIGNFAGQPHDLTYVHNATAQKPIPRRWARWSTEYFPTNEGRTLQRHPRRRRKPLRPKRRPVRNIS